MRHINIYVIITFEMAILKISCNLGFNWGGGGGGGGGGGCGGACEGFKWHFKNSVNCKYTNIHLGGIKMTLVC